MAAEKTTEPAKTKDVPPTKIIPGKEQVEGDKKIPQEGGKKPIDPAPTQKLETAKKELKNRGNELKEAQGEKTQEELFRDWPSPLVKRPGGDVLSNPEELPRKEVASKAVLENSEKSFSQALTVKHNADIEVAVSEKELKDINAPAREKVYTTKIASVIKYDAIPDLDKKKQETRKKLEDEAFKKLPAAEQDHKIQETIIAEQAHLLVQEVERFKRLSLEDQKKPDNLKKLSDVSENQLGIKDSSNLVTTLLDDAVTKKQIIKNIQEKGMMESGIDIASPIGKSLVDLARADYETYVSQMSDKASLDDLPMNIRQNLFWNKDFLGANQDMPSKLSREIQVVKNQLQVREGEDETGRNKRIDEAFKSTGVSRESVERGARHFNRENMDPFVRFLADLLAPIGAMMGGKTGEFWKQYMQESGGNPQGDSDSPLSNGSRGLEGGTIDAKYSADNEKNVQEYIAKGADPAYQNKISSTAQNIERYQSKYQAVSDALKQKGKIIPWEVIGAIHEREGSLDFSTCLHNGDPLNRVTTHVPKGLGPFSSWESAAVDALSRETYIDGMDTTTVQGLARVAEFSERFNGLGYRSKKRTSPYVWAGAPFYTGGRYVADGVYSASSKDSRPGTMPVVMELAKKRPNFAGFAQKDPNVAKNDVKGAPSKEVFVSNSPVAFIGDSHMNFLTNGLGYNPYGADKKLPGKSVVDVPTVMSGGNMGATGYSILQRINSPEGSEYIKNKKQVVICLGTNDATMSSSETMVTNMNTIVKNVQSINQDAKITIVTPPRNALPEVNQKVEQYIAGLNQSTFNANVRIADFYTYSQEKHLSMQDKDHLSTSSYNEMKKYILEHML